ncbi:MAG: peroxiredoxin [Candidatus Komeilibacteria bacterium CG_4_10_14_0_2_um_filter_37_10]|uniref:Peroxiredoxin n=1 Tax=Candidatus Komeilibacteria bacterium CG_4_10_14_0_2_um_filter_37_10 TaxID=1974470 RepID=A0A2M7VEF7_9BACT|nr:MAG: peroxiredoxin [Candidatus Komeilibacteria bacterium CG_4_10_14_0_2_um_filter_37_10]
MDSSEKFLLPIIGTKLPELDFEIFLNESISKTSFQEFKNKWLILFFYPADFTFVCPTELSQLADFYGEFQKEGAEVLSVSTDTAFVHKAWHDHSESIAKIKFPMVADPTGKLSRSFGVYLADEGLALRGSFIVDPDGVIQAYEVHANNIGRNIKELLRKLQAAKFVRENGGEACPVNWQPGDKTLRPSTDLVGKL